jgi:hypothetical protein
MDCKAHRKTRHLEIKLVHFEQLHLEQHNFDEELVIAAFLDAIRQFCHFQQCDSVSLTKAHPKHLSQPIIDGLNFF